MALGFTRLVRGMLFGVPSVDSATYIAMAALMAIVALAGIRSIASRVPPYQPSMEAILNLAS